MHFFKDKGRTVSGVILIIGLLVYGTCIAIFLTLSLYTAFSGKEPSKINTLTQDSPVLTRMESRNKLLVKNFSEILTKLQSKSVKAYTLEDEQYYQCINQCLIRSYNGKY